MFLKSIELFGFKSFADKSYIEFTGGISALLGPNGCGKSNVVDAVKWVLGEQSTRTLRAEKMEDVIFNGTESRKALSVAEVTLVLSNDEGSLPIDRSEIAVKRRLYRSGESEYYVNNVSTKLRDLRELFYDTGIGKSAYSIMEQGRIDQIGTASHPRDMIPAYFYVPKGMRRVLMHAYECGNVRVHDSKGEMVHEVISDGRIVTIPVHEGQDGRPWSIGLTNDMRLGRFQFLNLPTVLSMSPQYVFVSKETAKADGLNIVAP